MNDSCLFSGPGASILLENPKNNPTMRTAHDLQHFVLRLFQISNSNPKFTLRLSQLKDEEGLFCVLNRSLNILYPLKFLRIKPPCPLLRVTALLLGQYAYKARDLKFSWGGTTWIPSILFNTLKIIFFYFAERLIDADFDPMNLAGSSLLVDIGNIAPTSYDQSLSSDIVCNYVNVKMVRGESRGMLSD